MTLQRLRDLRRVLSEHDTVDVAGPRQIDPEFLTDPARKLMNAGLREFFQADEPQIKPSDFLPFFIGQARLELEAKHHVVRHIEPRKKSVFLKHDHPLSSRSGYRFPVAQHRSFVR